jgi:hypothetical protein
MHGARATFVYSVSFYLLHHFNCDFVIYMNKAQNRGAMKGLLNVPTSSLGLVSPLQRPFFNFPKKEERLIF